MILDSQFVFSGATGADGTKTPQYITATAVSTNVIDLQATPPPWNIDQALTVPLFIVVQVGQSFNNLTSLRISVEHDTVGSMAFGEELASVTLPLAALVAGATVMRMPLPSADHRRYLGLRYTVTGTVPAQGGLYAFLTENPPRAIAYRSRVTLDV